MMDEREGPGWGRGSGAERLVQAKGTESEGPLKILICVTKFWLIAKCPF